MKCIGLLLVILSLPLVERAGAGLITNAPVFFGYRFQAEGIYLGNVQQPGTADDPHIVIKDIPTNLCVSLTVVNGYKHDILLRCDYLDWSALALQSTVYYDKQGMELRSEVTGFVLKPVWFPDWKRKRYEPLPRIEPPREGNIGMLGGAPTIRGLQVPLDAPTNTARIELTLQLDLEYYIVGDTNVYWTTTGLRVRLTRPEKANQAPESAVTPAH